MIEAAVSIAKVKPIHTIPGDFMILRGLSVI